MLQASRPEIARFIADLFRYADEGTFISARAFPHEAGKPATFVEGVKINGSAERVTDAIARLATRAANAAEPSVFAPPVATFRDSYKATTADLANGVALSVELDEGDTAAAMARLQLLLGPVTLAIASGGEWTDYETGEVFPKLHLHWRLSEPTREPDDHAKLRAARNAAMLLVGSDPTAVPLVHPLRWPGSWHLKGKPKLAMIYGGNPASEIHLADALERLEEAVEAAGLKLAASDGPRISGEPQASVSRLRPALMAIPNPDLHWDEWVKMGLRVHRATVGSDEGLALWEEWSRQSNKFISGACDERWAHFHAHAFERMGAGTIFYMAKAHGWAPLPCAEAEAPDTDPDDPGWQPDERNAPIGSVQKAPPAPDDEGLLLADPRTWTGPPPRREWVVDHWLPRGYVSALYGDGGLGKSLLAQQLLTSVAVGRPWLGLEVKQGRALGFMCEDDVAELQRRQEAINRSLAAVPDDLDHLRFASRLGDDNLLMVFDGRDQGSHTPTFDALMRLCERFRPDLVVLDTIADIYGGDELRRAQVRQFVQNVGGKIARRFNCAVLLCGHPSAAGMASKTGTGGSTAWSNTVRSRLYLSRPEAQDGKEADGDIRLLSRMKANYAPKQGELKIRWSEGAFVLDAEAPKGPTLTWEQIEITFREMDDAWKRGDPWSHAPQTRKDGRYLPRWCAQTFGANEKAVGKLLEDWLTGGFLKVAIYDQDTKMKGLKVMRWLHPT